jgi:hypothetical protein
MRMAILFFVRHLLQMLPFRSSSFQDHKLYYTPLLFYISIYRSQLEMVIWSMDTVKIYLKLL